VIGALDRGLPGAAGHTVDISSIGEVEMSERVLGELGFGTAFISER
jgi:hypothetical protein